ncbi:hypothetical protein E1264_35810, partial [Actinomadura sp. KC216]|uniref:hypothetical protein n=1 Tax=Actinomadura sp. KC216 TaxID=2530370 RepID=UPI00104EF21F
MLPSPDLAVSAAAGPVLADSTRLGDAAFMAVGPAVIFVAVIAWIVVTLVVAQRQPRRSRRSSGLPHRGPVQGGVILGSPSQRTSRDPIPPRP